LKVVVPGLFDPEDEDTTIVGNIDNYIPINMVYIQEDLNLQHNPCENLGSHSTLL
jgi:nitrate reductase NapAB chaperone NapD